MHVENLEIFEQDIISSLIYAINICLTSSLKSYKPSCMPQVDKITGEVCRHYWAKLIDVHLFKIESKYFSLISVKLMVVSRIGISVSRAESGTSQWIFMLECTQDFYYDHPIYIFFLKILFQ